MATVSQSNAYDYVVFNGIQNLKRHLDVLKPLMTKSQFLSLTEPHILNVFNEVEVREFTNPKEFYQAQYDNNWQCLTLNMRSSYDENFPVTEKVVTRFIRGSKLIIATYNSNSEELKEYQEFLTDLLDSNSSSGFLYIEPQFPFSLLSTPIARMSKIYDKVNELMGVLHSHHKNTGDLDGALSTALVRELAKLSWHDDQVTTFRQITGSAGNCDGGTLEFIRAFKLAKRSDYQTKELPAKEVFDSMVSWFDTHPDQYSKDEWTRTAIALTLKYYEVDKVMFIHWLDSLQIDNTAQYEVDVRQEARDNTEFDN